MNSKCSFGSIGNPAIRPIEFSFCFVLDRRAAAANSTSPNQTFSANPPAAFKRATSLLATGLQPFLPLLQVNLLILHFFSFIKLEGTCFRVDICAELSIVWNHWPEIRGSNTCIFYIFVRAAMPFIFLFDIFDTIISYIFTDILLYSFISLHRLDFRISLAFNASIFILFYFYCTSHFALMAKPYFICLCILYVCTYYSPLLLVL